MGAIQKLSRAQMGVSGGGKYIKFADPEVERVLLANGVSSDGVGITTEDVEKVTSISTWFQANTSIKEFEELEKFSSIDKFTSGSNTGTFRNCTSLERVALPKNLTSLKTLVSYGNAFYGCTALNYVKWAQGVTDIAHASFQNCISLTHIDGLDWNRIVNIENNAFSGSSLSDEIRSSSIKSIGDWAFYNSNVGGDLYLPNLESIANRSFKGCASLASVSSLGKITELGPYTNWSGAGYGVFQGCTSLSRVVLPLGLTKVGHTAFGGCSSLVDMDWVDSISVVEANAFNGCSSWAANAEITNLTTVNENAFYNTPNTSFIIRCPNLTGAIGYCAFFQSGVVRVEDLGTITAINPNVNHSWANGFHSSLKLEYVKLPSTLTSICIECFNRCSKLSTLICEATTPPTLGHSSFSNTPIASGTGYIYVPNASVDAYKAATNWATYAAQIKGYTEVDTLPSSAADGVCYKVGNDFYVYQTNEFVKL